MLGSCYNCGRVVSPNLLDIGNNFDYRITRLGSDMWSIVLIDVIVRAVANLACGGGSRICGL